MRDVFRPTADPAQTIYDALITESELRSGRSVDEWIAAEKNAVWKAAHDYAQQYGLRIPTIADVEQAETQAMGHCDYAAKYAYGVVRCMA
jgi:hypothetical protein